MKFKVDGREKAAGKDKRNEIQRSGLKGSILGK